jgi:AraC-like DNA-binding protein
MYQAMRMLREERQSLSTIAHAVGYDTDSAFAKAFRRFTGMPPGGYRRDEALYSMNPTGTSESPVSGTPAK